MNITILGSGTSHGIPVAGCDCAVCRSDDVRDNRYRAALYVEGAGGERLVIDTPPEFRLQAIRAGLYQLDALFFTHDHADHLHGLDDVRPFTVEKPLPAYGGEAAIAGIRRRFDYIFTETQEGGGKPHLLLTAVSAPVRLGGLVLTPVPVKHGNLDIYGWKITEGNAAFVYITDASGIPPASLSLIANADCLVIGALRARPHPTHFTFEEAGRVVRQTGAKQGYFTHICHEHSHREIEAFCAQSGLNLRPAYDGLSVQLLKPTGGC